VRSKDGAVSGSPEYTDYYIYYYYIVFVFSPAGKDHLLDELELRRRGYR